MTISALLDKSLSILKPYLDKKNITEISINKPGEVWLENNKGWKLIKDKNLTLTALNYLAQNLATESGQLFNEEVPFLSMLIPGYNGYRLQVVGGSVVTSGIAYSIRVMQALSLKLSHWFNNNEIKQLQQIITNKKNVLISGGTSSGKTTLLNSLLKEIDKKERIITIEDTQELVITQPNCLHFIKSKTATDVANVSYESLINASLRMRPDRILIGEIDIENTPRFLRILNIGHAGSFATIHANSPSDAIDALVMNAKLSGLKGDDDTIIRFAKNYLDVIIQVKCQNRQKFSASIEVLK